MTNQVKYTGTIVLSTLVATVAVLHTNLQRKAFGKRHSVIIMELYLQESSQTRGLTLNRKFLNHAFVCSSRGATRPPENQHKRRVDSR
jgi:hypothetical protein